VTRGGGVWAWGHNIDGQLGDGGTTTDRMSPVPVPGLSCVIRVAVTYHTSFALRGDGTVWSWGTNDDGDLGIGRSDPNHGADPTADPQPDRDHPDRQAGRRLVTGLTEGLAGTAGA
jgi:alpha-tubulin suppressor-like RCC1 family protein